MVDRRDLVAIVFPVNRATSKTGLRPTLRALGLALGLGLASSCASVQFDRTEKEAGVFHSSAWSMTILGLDLPGNALMIARANASDSALPNMEVTEETRRPYLGRFNWILNIFSIRYASVDGTWGFPTHD